MAAGKLNTLTIRRMTKPGNYPDGGNLYLRITASGGKSWAFRYKRRIAGEDKSTCVNGGSKVSIRGRPPVFDGLGCS
jgi:hypothetical protein